MPKTQVSCPNCRQPVPVELTQLFDNSADPTAKQRLLSGTANFIQCPYCGYQGNLATLIVYHDADKELLLTFVPPEMGLPRNEQERVIGALINQAINKLPQEKRKGYLLKPQETLTMQGLIERVLEADGVTREMLQAQQARLNLLQRLANTTDESVRAEVAMQEDALIDGDFFALLSRVAEVAMANNDRESAQQLSDLQATLLESTTYGKQLQAQSDEIEAAIADLQAIGRELDRPKLLDLLINAENEIRLSALVSLARAGMDYEFFQLLSGRIEAAAGEEQTRLSDLRTRLLQMTQEIDRQIEAHRQQVRQLIEAVIQTPDPVKAMSQAINAVDETFVRELREMINEARSKGDVERSGKLQQLIDVLQQASAPPEMGLIEEFLDQPDEAARDAFLESHSQEITPEFMELLGGIVMQVQAGEDKEFAAQVLNANRQALRFAMKRNMS
jgi:hypothetical protein